MIPLFDIDNTLLKSGNKAHRESFNFALKTIYQLPSASIDDVITAGKIDTQILLEIAKLHHYPENDLLNKLPKAIEAMKLYYSEHRDEGEVPTMKGVNKLLEILKNKDVSCGLLTGNVEMIGWDKINKAGLKDYFLFGAFGNLAYKRVDLISIAKDRAEKILNKKLKISDFFIVGDTPLDVACAKEGGIKVIAVAQGNYSKKELQDAGADLVLESLEDTKNFLKFL